MRRFKATFLLSLRKYAMPRLVAVGVGAVLGLVSLLALKAPLGAIMATLFTGILTLFISVVAFAEDYGASVRLGTSRRAALAAVTVESLLMPLAMLALSLLMEQVEYLCLGGRLGEGILLGKLPIVIGIYVGLWLMGMLGGWCIRRFGHNGVMVMYIAYIVLFVFVPQLFSRLIVESNFLQSLVTSIVANAATLTGVLIGVAVMLTAVLLVALYKCDV